LGILFPVVSAKAIPATEKMKIGNRIKNIFISTLLSPSLLLKKEEGGIWKLLFMLILISNPDANEYMKEFN